VKLFSKNSNACNHNPPTSQTDRQTDRQLIMALVGASARGPAFSWVHCPHPTLSPTFSSPAATIFLRRAAHILISTAPHCPSARAGIRHGQTDGHDLPTTSHSSRTQLRYASHGKKLYTFEYCQYTVYTLIKLNKRTFWPWSLAKPWQLVLLASLHFIRW